MSFQFESSLKTCLAENSDALAVVIATGLRSIIEEDLFLWFTLDKKQNAIIEVCIGADEREIIHRVKLSEVVEGMISGNDNEPMITRFADILEEQAKRCREYLK